MEDEQSDAVRIMTIHKSKGLEFPIVFVAGMGKRFNLQDARSMVTLHADLGIGLEAVDLTQRTKSPSLIKKIIQKEEVLDSLAEELRVLYVAFTRAKEKLIISGILPGAEEKLAVAVREEKGREGACLWEIKQGGHLVGLAPSGAGRDAGRKPCGCKDPGSWGYY